MNQQSTKRIHPALGAILVFLFLILLLNIPFSIAYLLGWRI